MNLIYDRTAQDVQRWRTLAKKGWLGMNEAERTEWMGFMKGRYTAADMNRVEKAVEVISARLREVGYLHTTLTVKTDWTASDSPARADFDRYFGNVEAMREFLPIPPTLPKTPTTADRLDYTLANDLEKIVAFIDDISQKLGEARYYAGDLYLGEV